MNASSGFMNNPNRACAGAPLDAFITSGDDDDEPPYPTPKARQLCNFCPVRTDCLMYALEHGIDFGTYGGMSAYQRELLGKKKPRKKCPSCSATDIIVENNNEICLACGTSWDIF
jgi:hypothetical protein